MAAEVRVRTAGLGVSAHRLAALRAHLTEAERAREERLLRAERRERFVAARGWLREELGEILGLVPAGVPIDAGINGKPRLDPAAVNADVRFNLSHSGDWALLAVCDGREVGADIEREEPGRDIPGLARRVLAPAELAEWEALPHDARVASFFAIWTRKEAYAKGLGEGLGVVMRDHPLEPARQAGRFLVGGDWLVADVEAPDGYSAAVAVANAGDAGCRIVQAPPVNLDR